jgi:hypothetical protein
MKRKPFWRICAVFAAPFALFSTPPASAEEAAWTVGNMIQGRGAPDRPDAASESQHPPIDGLFGAVTRYIEPEPEVNLLLKKPKLDLPAQPPPKITARAPASSTPL